MSQTGDSSAEILLKGFKKASNVAISHSKGRNLLLDIVHRIERILEHLLRIICGRSSRRIISSTREVTQNLLTSMRKATVTHYTQVSLFTFHYIYGTCSNLFNPIQGATHTAFRNLIPPFYEDGVDAPRMLIAMKGM